MKNIRQYLLICSLSVFVQCSKAQNYEFYYTDFDPDIKLIENYQDTLGLDFDRDGRNDVLVYYKHFGSVAERYGAMKTTNDNWEIAYCRLVDSISLPHPDIPTFGWGSEESLMDPNAIYPNNKYGLRFQKGSDYYYGWLSIYCDYNSTTDKVEIIVDKMAFCNIPNYPLCWGQTGINTEIDENTFTAFATVNPNPTNGMVTITGLNLRQAEVINTLGQRVAIVHGEGNQLSVNISNLPAGIYFVNVTDEEGRKCVRKVVKE